MSVFNAVDSLVQGFGHAYQGRWAFTGVWEQFWSDALSVSTSDSYGYQWDLNPGLLDAIRLP